MSNQPSQLANPKTPQSQGIVALLRAKNQILYEILNWKQSKITLSGRLLPNCWHVSPIDQFINF